MEMEMEMKMKMEKDDDPVEFVKQCSKHTLISLFPSDIKNWKLVYFINVIQITFIVFFFLIYLVLGKTWTLHIYSSVNGV